MSDETATTPVPYPPANVAGLDLRLALFLIGLNIKILYDILVVLRITIYPPIEYLAFGFFAFSVVVSVAVGWFREFRPFYRGWLVALGVILTWPLLYGWYSGHSRYYMSWDLFALTYLSGLFVGARGRNWTLIDRTVTLNFGLVALLCWALILGSQRQLFYEEIVWTPIYGLWGLLYAWDYFMVPSNEGGLWRRVVGAGGVLAFVLLSILFEKRAPIVNVGIVLVLIVLTAWRLRRARRPRALAPAVPVLAAVVALGIVGVVLGTQRNAIERASRQVWQRFVGRGGVQETVLENYRWTYQVDAVMKNTRAVELLLGRGVGAAIPAPYAVSAESYSGVLHNGS